MDYPLTVSIIRAALDRGQPAFARRTAERWLMAQPGHLTISALLAQALLISGDHRDVVRADRLLRQVLEVDPENESALMLRIHLHELKQEVELAWATAASLRQVAPDNQLAHSKLGRLATRPLDRAAWRQETGADSLARIPALAGLEKQWRAGERNVAKERAEALLAKYPRLAKAHLILADCLMAQGDELTAVAHIHQAAGLDPGGEVAQQLWDGKQPYVRAWPPAHVTGAAGPLPHPVASALGLNLLREAQAPAPSNGKVVLPTPPPAAPPPPPPISPVREVLLNLQTEVNRLSGVGGDAIPADKSQEKQVRLQPVYALVSSKKRLQAKYGQDGWEQIDGALQALAKAAEAQLGLPAGVLYLDDANSLASFQLEPVDPADPWAIKTLLNQLEDRLKEQQQQIGWLLLVGGPDIVPFHRLPNPADDGDVETPSDNPYACRDENYFIPQRAVGRLPDAAGDNPTVLLRSISTALAAHHASRRAQKGWLRRWWRRLVELLRGRPAALASSFGYSASVWRKASLAVFSRIGSARRLRISPPLTAAEFSGLALGPARYGYFNLHGVADGSAWYGQRDPTFPADHPLFPVALRPQDVGVGGSVPEVVFSEACYGALVEGKTAETALCLKFLASGAQIFAGSTCIAYGGLNSSLEAADLLASFFWQEIKTGRSGGVALQQAKVAFAQHLDQRQGYLDGEEQKTLISFVYYGDPTLTAPLAANGLRLGKRKRKTWHDLTAGPQIVCAKMTDCNSLESAPAELVNQVRERVARYLPGMEQASLTVARQRVCRGKSCRPRSASAGAKAKPAATDKMVFTLHKSAQVAGELHEQVVKVTVDDRGKMLKLMVSK